MYGNSNFACQIFHRIHMLAVFLTSKCRCGPVDSPVLPDFDITLPFQPYLLLLQEACCYGHTMSISDPVIYDYCIAIASVVSGIYDLS